MTNHTQDDLHQYIIHEVHEELAVFKNGQHAAIAQKLIHELSSKAQGMYVNELPDTESEQ